MRILELEAYMPHALLSLLATPLLVFLSNAIAVYLRNQADLSYQFEVVLPFVYMALGLFLVGVILRALSSSRVGNWLLWVYYLAGPCFLLFSLLKAIPALHLGQHIGFAIFLVLCGATSVVVARRNNATDSTPLFAFLALLLIGTEIARFVSFSASAPVMEQSARPAALKSASSTLPNIYHVILDEFQTSYFANTSNSALKESLDGFTFYRDTTTLYDMTQWSVPSVFLGKHYAFDESVASYQDRAFNSDESVMHSLRDAGYSSIAYTRKLFQSGMRLIDIVVPHASNIDVVEPDHQETFTALWIYSSLPRFVAESMAYRELFIDRNSLLELRERTFLASSSAQESYLSFNNYLKQEESLPARGRYTLLHLLIPHGPYVFDADCNGPGPEKTDILGQSECALKLLGQLVSKLKELNRYDDSLIVVHGDHGARNEPLGGRWRSPYTLLLVKSQGQQGEIKVSDAPISIPDLAGAFNNFFEGAGRGQAADFTALLEAQQSSRTERKFYRVRGEREMLEHVLQDGTLDKGVVKQIMAPQMDYLEQLDLPIVPLNTEFEAEDGHLSGGVTVRDNLPGVSGSYIVNGTKTYSFELDHAAEVVVHIRVISPSGTSDSNFLRLNGGRLKLWSVGIGDNWRWSKSPHVWKLEKGRHIFSLEYREPIYIDQIKLVTKPIAGASKF
ncbi:MAG: sulfatase-like hydrolase/transferase [Pseudomonadales bacterium]